MNREVTTEAAQEAADSMDDFARMAGIDATGPRSVLETFLARAEVAQRVAAVVEQMFTSGNAFPVERITLTRAQWEAAKNGQRG